MRIARHVRIRGRVQGVFFRAWTRDTARSKGIAGWVRNCPDGSVEARIEGDAAALDALSAQLREGPPGARVDTLDVEQTEVQDLSGFTVRH